MLTAKTERAERSKPSRFTLFVIVVAVCILGYFAFRWMRGLMMLGFVDSAISPLRVISAAETQIAKAYPELGYTCALSKLPRSEEITRLLAQNRIDNGYAFDIIGCQATESHKPNAAYYVTARSLHNGQPAFCSDQSGVIMFDEGGFVDKCIAKRTPFP
jgi:hypothetical protein